MSRKTDSPAGTDPAVSSDLDAYRRHRGATPRPHEDPFISALDALTPSAHPHVLFGRLADVCVPHLADGCQIELADGVDEPLHVLVEVDRHPDDDVAAGVHGAVEVPFQMASRGGQPSYSGIVTFWWHHRDPVDADWTLAQLLVRHAAGLVDRQRLMERTGSSESRAASAAMDVIASRQVNLAIGILMGRTGSAASDAEEELARLAEESSVETYTAAAELVRSNHLRRSAAGRVEQPDGDVVRPLRPDD